MSHNISTWRRRLAWRSTHRGIKELDIILGQFALRVLPTLNAAALGEYERILELPDDELYVWLSRQKPLPKAQPSRVMAKLMRLDYMR